MTSEPIIISNLVLSDIYFIRSQLQTERQHQIHGGSIKSKPNCLWHSLYILCLIISH